MPIRIFPSILLAAIITEVLTGCTTPPGPLETSVSLTIGQDDAFYVPPSLEATAAQFFRPKTGPTKKGSLLVDIDRDTLSPGSKTPYSQTHSMQTRLSGRAELPLGRHISLNGGLTLAKGSSKYLLPTGAGVLIDPITVTFQTTSAELEAGLAWRFNATDRLSARFELGGGGSIARTRTHIASALLDVENTSNSKAGFIYTGVGVRLGQGSPRRPALSLNSRVKYYPRMGVSFQTGVSLEY